MDSFLDNPERRGSKCRGAWMTSPDPHIEIILVLLTDPQGVKSNLDTTHQIRTSTLTMVGSAKYGSGTYDTEGWSLIRELHLRKIKCAFIRSGVTENDFTASIVVFDYSSSSISFSLIPVRLHFCHFKPWPLEIRRRLRIKA